MVVRVDEPWEVSARLTKSPPTNTHKATRSRAAKASRGPVWTELESQAKEPSQSVLLRSYCTGYRPAESKEISNVGQ